MSSNATATTDVDTTMIEMRSPCPKCGDPFGVVTETGGQRVVRCHTLDHWCYNQPNGEAGVGPRSVRSHATLKPKARARVLAAHGHQCVACGRSPQRHSIVLHVDHIIPLALAERHGLLDDVIHSETNMAPLCEECNLGKRDNLDGISVQLVYRVLLLKRDHSTPKGQQ